MEMLSGSHGILIFFLSPITHNVNELLQIMAAKANQNVGFFNAVFILQYSR